MVHWLSEWLQIGFACDCLCIADKDCREAMILGACPPRRCSSARNGAGLLRRVGRDGTQVLDLKSQGIRQEELWGTDGRRTDSFLKRFWVDLRGNVVQDLASFLWFMPMPRLLTLQNGHSGRDFRRPKVPRTILWPCFSKHDWGRCITCYSILGWGPSDGWKPLRFRF